MTKVGLIGSAVALATAALGLVEGCSNSSSPGGAVDAGESDASTSFDGTGPGDSSTTDSTVADSGHPADGSSGGDAAADTGTTPGSDSGTDAGLVNPSVGPGVVVSGFPTALAYDSANNSLYVGLKNAQGIDVGVAVIDTTNDTLVTTIPALSPGGTAVSRLVVDPNRNLVYAAATNDIVWIINGANNTVGTTPIHPTPAGDIITDLAIDPVGDLLYVAYLSFSDSNVYVTAVDTLSANVGTPVTMTDFSNAGFATLALNTATGHLFVCSEDSNTNTSVTVDLVDTTTHTETTGGQQIFNDAGFTNLVGCQGAPGVATALTGNTDMTLHVLEPYNVTFPGFTPTAYHVDDVSSVGAVISVMGTDPAGTPAWLNVFIKPGTGPDGGPVYAEDAGSVSNPTRFNYVPPAAGYTLATLLTGVYNMTGDTADVWATYKPGPTLGVDGGAIPVQPQQTVFHLRFHTM